MHREIKKSVKMKKCILSFILLLTCGYITKANDCEIVIILKQSDSIIQNEPRSNFVPIDCVYRGFDNSIYIDFAKNLGSVNITLTNFYTGDIVYKSFDSNNFQAVIQTSGTPGDYLLQIETESGDCYEGEFTVE